MLPFWLKVCIFSTICLFFMALAALVLKPSQLEEVAFNLIK